MNAFYLHPEMGDNGSGPVVIAILLLYFLVGAALVVGAVYLSWKLVARFARRR